MRKAVIIAAVLGVASTAAWVVVNMRAAQRALDAEQKAANEPPSWGEVRGHVVVSIWPRRWLELTTAADPGGPRILSRDFADGLVEVPEVEQVAIDEEMLRAWRVEEPEVFDVGRENVRHIEWTVDRVDGGIFGYPNPSPTSLLTWPETLTNLPVTGQRLVAFTHDQGLLADGARDESVAALLAVLEAELAKAAQDGKPMPLELSGRVLTYADSRWSEWAPPATFAERYRQLRAMADAIELERLAPASDAGR